MNRIALTGQVLAATLAVASPSLAQDAADDWDLTADPAQQLTLATLDFGDNALALRCKAGVLDLLLTGTPVTTDRFRVIDVTGPGIAEESQAWRTRPDLPVVSAAEPGRLARLLRVGGDLDLRLPAAAPGERRLRYRLPVPPSAASVDGVLSACSEPLTDEWDLRPRASNLDWARRPLPEYPQTAVAAGGPTGDVRVACIVPADGRLRDCRVVSETPAGVGFGQSALQSALMSNVSLPENDGSTVGAVVHFNIRFQPPPN